MTRTEKQTLIEEVVEHICDKKCKIPDELMDDDERQDACDECPINRLWALQREDN